MILRKEKLKDGDWRFRRSWILHDIVDPVSGVNCTTEFKAKNHPPAVSTATSAPRGPNLQVAPVGFVGIGYKLPSWTVMWRYPQLRDFFLKWIRPDSPAVRGVFMNTTRTQPNCVSTRPRRRAQLVGAHRASCEPSGGCPWHCYSAPSRRVLHRRSKRGRAAHAVTSPLTRARTTPASSLLASGAERSHTRVAVGLSLCPGPRNTVGARPCVVG